MMYSDAIFLAVCLAAGLWFRGEETVGIVLFASRKQRAKWMPEPSRQQPSTAAIPR
jgi:hypothetical protein